ISFLLFFSCFRPPPSSPLFPYTTLFRSPGGAPLGGAARSRRRRQERRARRSSLLHHLRYTRSRRSDVGPVARAVSGRDHHRHARSEEHTSELQSRRDLVCRLLLEKKKRK